MLNTWILAAEETAGNSEEAGGISVLIPPLVELIVGGLAFLIVFFVLWKFAFPALNKTLAARSDSIQGEMEKAESARTAADEVLADYRAQLASAREDANAIIEEARTTADQLRRDLQAKAAQEAEATVARAQEEIRAERDRVFEELRGQVGEIAVELAGRVVGQSLDKKTHERLIDDYIDQVATSGDGKG